MAPAAVSPLGRESRSRHVKMARRIFLCVGNFPTDGSFGALQNCEKEGRLGREILADNGRCVCRVASYLRRKELGEGARNLLQCQHSGYQWLVIADNRTGDCGAVMFCCEPFTY